MKYLLLLFALLGSVSTASANPVSFKDGWGIMASYGRDWADYQVNYSLTNRYSFGLSDYWREGDDEKANFGIAQFNYLLKRWNEIDSQANIYASIGAGIRDDSEHDESLAGYAALEANYETRRIYTSISAETLQSANNVAFNKIRGRAGFAPYLAPFESLQTWLIAQVEYSPEMEDETTITPLVRFFYYNYALEAGASLDGKLFIGTMAHF